MDYAVCTLGVDNRSYYIFKLHNVEEELFLIGTEEFETKCPDAASNFAIFQKEFLEVIEEIDKIHIPQKLNALLGKEFFNDRLAGLPDVYSTAAPCYTYERRNFRQLFQLCLQSTMGLYMSKTVDYSLLHGCAMAFFQDREPLFDYFSYDFVEHGYMSLFEDLIKPWIF